MLTPTNVTASAFNNAIKSDAPCHIKMTFTGQSIVLEDEDIESSGAIIQDMLNADTDLVFGKAVMYGFSCNILNSSKLNGIDWNGEFKLELGVEISGTTEYITLGYFTGTRPEKVTNVEIITFTAYDRMQKFDVLADDWLASLTYPMTVAQIYASLCTYVGVSSESGNELANIMSRSFSAAPIDVTGLMCRDVLALIAEACGCYAKISASGKVKMVWFTDQTSYALTGDDEFAVDGFDIPIAYVGSITGIDGLSVKQTEDDIGVLEPSGATGNIYLIVDNPFLVTANATDVTNYITPIYNRLSAFGGYLPCNVQCVGNPLVEAGDIITAYVNGQSVSMPVFVKTMRFNGHCIDLYEATGSMKRERVSTANKQKLSQGGRYHKFRNDIDGLYSELYDPTTGDVIVLQQGFSGLATRMSNAEGDISSLEQTTSGLGTRVSNAEGDISTLQQTTSGLSTRVGNAEGDISTLQQTTSGLSTRVGNAEGDISTLQQTTSGLSTRVGNAEGDISTLQQTTSGLATRVGTAEGNITAVDQKADGIALVAAKKVRTYYASTAPTGTTADPLEEGDIWFDTGNGNNPYRWNGSAWVGVSDGNKYTVQSGIAIDANGVEITGSKYVKIKSGATFDVDSTNFKIDSTNKYITIYDTSIDSAGMFINSDSDNYYTFRISGNSGSAIYGNKAYHFGINPWYDYVSTGENILSFVLVDRTTSPVWGYRLPFRYINGKIHVGNDYQSIYANHEYNKVYYHGTRVLPQPNDDDYSPESTYIGTSSNAWDYGYFTNLYANGDIVSPSKIVHFGSSPVYHLGTLISEPSTKPIFFSNWYDGSAMGMPSLYGSGIKFPATDQSQSLMFYMSYDGRAWTNGYYPNGLQTGWIKLANENAVVLKSGDTMTGELCVPTIGLTGSALLYSGDSNHTIVFGTSGVNHFDFHEYGGIWRFYKKTSESDDNLINEIENRAFKCYDSNTHVKAQIVCNSNSEGELILTGATNTAAYTKFVRTDAQTMMQAWDGNGNAAYPMNYYSASNQNWVSGGFIAADNVWGGNGAYNLYDVHTKTNGIDNDGSGGGYTTDAQLSLYNGQQAIILAGANLFMVYNGNGTLYSSGIPSGFTATLSSNVFTLSRSTAFVWNYIKFKVR